MSIRHIKFSMSGLFEENSFMKNCGISLIIGRNETSGRQSVYHTCSTCDCQRMVEEL